MAVTPNTNIKLLKVPIEIDNKNQLSFSNTTAQYNYFNSLPKIEIDECSYQRKDNIIRFPAHIDSILEYNYVMYQNENYNNKWFYAFIVNMEYQNDTRTDITIATDVFQTWQFDLNWKQSFIEREMISVNEDIPGANLLPEGLETGEVKVNATAEFDDLEPVNVIAYSGNKIPISLTGDIEGDLSQGGYKINGISSSIVYLLAPTHYTLLMNNLQKSNYSDYIIACFTVPKLAVKDFLNNDYKVPNMAYDIFCLGNGINGQTEFLQTATTKTLLSTPNTLDGYTPRNQKLRTYPYLYLGFNPSNRFF